MRGKMLGMSVWSSLFLLVASSSELTSTAKINEEFLYGVFTQRCWDQIFVERSLDFQCFKLILSKLLGYGIVFASSILKLPQIINIIKARSTEGLAEAVLYTETFGYMLGVFYPMHYGQPFSTYGENFFISIQAMVILCLLWYYNSAAYSSREIAGLVICYVSFALTLYEGSMLSDQMWMFLYVVLPQLMVASRVEQIRKNYTNKSTGTLSLITCLFYMMGSLARVFTTIVEVNDKLVWMGYTISFVVNTTLTLQVLCYWKSGAKATTSYAAVQGEELKSVEGEELKAMKSV
eukprot:TRINITY_DN2913_c0_g5_i1.p1 TRINITY_DN2913_c0_g5~~TRINITY_DN2913_c0_g5_i1.p1  ORF type:complete len:304 (+),score=67.43 TRINITY_DN2913_c0_g5_i1:38-913(+)